MTRWEVYLDAFLVCDRRARRGFFARILASHALLLLAALPVFGQQVALSLNSAVTTPGASATLIVSTATSGGVQPAILRWTMQYPVDVTGIQVDPGPAAVSAGKNIT